MAESITYVAMNPHKKQHTVAVGVMKGCIAEFVVDIHAGTRYILSHLFYGIAKLDT